MRCISLCALLAMTAMCEPPDVVIPTPSESCSATPTAVATETPTGAAPTETAGAVQPSCSTAYPDANTAWVLDGTTTWAIEGGPTWTTSMVVAASGAPCEPWPTGWGHVRVTTAEGVAMATASVPFGAAAVEWDPACPDCAAVWSVALDPEGVVSDPDNALSLLPASWLAAWSEHRQGVGTPDAVGDPAPIWWDMPALYPPGHEIADGWGVGYYAHKAPVAESQGVAYPVGDWTLAPSNYWPLTGPTGAVWSFGGVVRQRADGTTDWDGTFQISAWASRSLYNAGAPPTCTQPVVGWGITEVPDERARAACPSCTLAHRLSMTQTVIPLPDACPNDPKLDEFARLFGGHHFAYQASPPAIWTDFSTDLSYAQTLVPVPL